jgi:hypothetical protein
VSSLLRVPFNHQNSRDQKSGDQLPHMMEVDIQKNDLLFQSSFRMLLAGPSGSGKSQMIFNLIKYRKQMFLCPFSYIMYCRPPNPSSKDVNFENKLKEACDFIQFHDGLPNFEEISYISGEKLIILDDLILAVVSNSDVFNAITVGSNHHNINIILTTQNLYLQGKFSKTLLRNTTEKILFKDKSDKQWLETQSKQMFGDQEFLPRAMSWLQQNISNSYEHYILLDQNPKSKLHDDMLARTRILPDPKTGLIEPIFFQKAE